MGTAAPPGIHLSFLRGCRFACFAVHQRSLGPGKCGERALRTYTLQHHLNESGVSGEEEGGIWYNIFQIALESSASAEEGIPSLQTIESVRGRDERLMVESQSRGVCISIKILIAWHEDQVEWMHVRMHVQKRIVWPR